MKTDTPHYDGGLDEDGSGPGFHTGSEGDVDYEITCPRTVINGNKIRLPEPLLT